MGKSRVIDGLVRILRDAADARDVGAAGFRESLRLSNRQSSSQRADRAREAHCAGKRLEGFHTTLWALQGSNSIREGITKDGLRRRAVSPRSSPPRLPAAVHARAAERRARPAASISWDRL